MQYSQERIASEVTSYFKSDHWKGFVETLSRGEVIRHAHIYLESLLNPFDLAIIIEEYFKKINLPLERGTKILPIKAELLNIYNIKPKGMAHFEFFLRYNPLTILAPMSPEKAREKATAFFWDDNFMHEYYKQYSFREVTERDIEIIKEYFRSDSWREAYRIMTDEYAGIIHSHALVETSVHPEILLPYALESFDELGCKMNRAVSVVFNAFGKDIGKLTFLLSSPEVVVELEWHFNPRIVINSVKPNIFRIATDEMLDRFMARYERVSIDKTICNQIISHI